MASREIPGYVVTSVRDGSASAGKGLGGHVGGLHSGRVEVVCGCDNVTLCTAVDDDRDGGTARGGVDAQGLVWWLW